MVEYVPGIPILKPYIDADNKPYWDAVKDHKFVVQQCNKCKNYYQPPRPMCPECHTLDTMDFVPSSGKGIVHSYIIYTTDRMAYPGMKIPYAVMVVEMDEDVVGSVALNKYRLALPALELTSSLPLAPTTTSS